MILVFGISMLFITIQDQYKKKGFAMAYNYNERFMKRAIELSKEASIIKKTGGVFGAVIVKDDKIIAEGYNQVIKQNDPTWHAEMQAIREACKKIGSPHLKGCVMYTSAESCPMCLSASYWAHLEHIFYGATIEDAFKYGDFQDVGIYKDLCLPMNQRKIQATQVMQEQAVEVWKEFSKMPERARY